MSKEKPKKVKAVKPKAKKVKAAKVKSAKPKKAAKVKAAKVKAPKRIVGPGTKLFKFKDTRVKGKCDVLNCSKKAKNPRAFRCKIHTKKVRKQQLKLNNVTWRKRIADGTAQHHVVYTNPKNQKVDGGKLRLTKWAELNPDRAVAYVKKDKGTIELEKLKALLAKVKAA